MDQVHGHFFGSIGRLDHLLHFLDCIQVADELDQVNRGLMCWTGISFEMQMEFVSLSSEA